MNVRNFSSVKRRKKETNLAKSSKYYKVICYDDDKR